MWEGEVKKVFNMDLSIKFTVQTQHTSLIFSKKLEEEPLVLGGTGGMLIDVYAEMEELGLLVEEVFMRWLVRSSTSSVMRAQSNLGFA